jgi:hypothetical protein
MVQLIAFIIFLVSTLVVAFILLKKIPVLAELPQNGHHGFKKPTVVSDIEKKVRDFHFHFFKKQMLLHKLLSWSKVRILKIEHKIDTMLHGVRKKSQEVAKETKRRKKV